MKSKTCRGFDYPVIVLAGFLSQVFFSLTGGRFSLVWMTFMHLFDLDLLANRLLESVWYLHMQPPLFNLFTGSGIQLFPRFYGTAFGLVYFCLSLTLALTLYRLMRLLGVSRLPALGLTVLYQFCPADIIYRNFFYTTYLVMTSLVLAGYFLLRYLKTLKNNYGIVFFLLLGGLSLTRAVYQPVWYAATALGLIFLLKGRRLALSLMAAAPALVILIWMGKNSYLFGSFSMNTQLGFNLYGVTTQFLTVEEREDLRKAGKISPLADVYPFRRWLAFHEYLSQMNLSWHPAPALNRTHKWVFPDDYRQAPENYNHTDRIVLADQYFRDALTVIRRRPRAYLKGIVSSAMVYFMPTWRAYNVGVGGLSRGYQRAWMIAGGSAGRWHNEIDHGILRDGKEASAMVCWGLIAGYLLVPALFLRDGLRKIGFARWDRTRLIVLGWIGFNIAYITAAGILLDFGENNRFRAEIVPLTVVLVAVVLQRLFPGDRRGVRSPTGVAGKEKSAK